MYCPDLKMCIYTDNGSFPQFVWDKIQSDTKNGNFWKTQQKLKKSKKKHLLTEI